MAGRKDPAWPCYANDHLMDPDLLDLTPAEECAFFRLVSYLWANGPQPLSRLVKVAGMFRADAETVIRVVRLMMQVDDNEIVTSPRLEEERAERAGLREKRSKAGKAGAESRAASDQQDTQQAGKQGGNKQVNNSQANGEAKRQPPAPAPSPSPSSVPTPSHPSSHPTRTADVRPPTVVDGGLAGREVVPPEEDPPPESAASEATGRIINLARRRAGPSRPVPIGGAVDGVLAGLSRLHAGGAS